MSNKAKGSKAERELLSIFTENGWRALRVAGSGVNDNSPCDLIAAKVGKKGHTIEAKSSKSASIYITKEQINDFITYSLTLGLAPVIATRFNREGWFFFTPDQLKDTGKNWVINLATAKSAGKRFGQFFDNEVIHELTV